MPNYDQTRKTAGGTIEVTITTSNDYSTCDIKSVGKRTIGFDDSMADELIFFPSSIELTFRDPSRAMYDSLIANKESVQVLRNTNAYFAGAVDPLQTRYSDKEKTTQITVIDGASALKSIYIRDGGGNAMNPLAYHYLDGSYVNIVDVITRIFKCVNPSLPTLTIDQDWVFKEDPGDGGGTHAFDEINTPHDPLFKTTMPFATLSDLLRALAESFGCRAGMMDFNNAYFVKRWKSSVTPTALEGSVKTTQRTGFLFPVQVVKATQLSPSISPADWWDDGSDRSQGDITTDYSTPSGDFRDPATGYANPSVGYATSTQFGGTDSSTNLAILRSLAWIKIGTIKDASIDSNFREVRQAIAKYYYKYRQIPRPKYQIDLYGLGWSFLTPYSYGGKLLRPSKLAEDVEKNLTTLYARDIS